MAFVVNLHLDMGYLNGMSKRYLLILFAVFLSRQPSLAETGQAQVGLMIMLDLSATMKDNHKKAAAIAPLILEMMDKSKCNIKVGVSNVSYRFKNFSLKPWGEPTFVEKTMGREVYKTEIEKRIVAPMEAIFGKNYDEDQDPKPSSSDERTYTSILQSIQVNKNDLKDLDLVAYLVISDALPAYDYINPSQAQTQIFEELGHRNFMAGAIGANVSGSPQDIVFPGFTKKRGECRYDYHQTTASQKGSPISPIGFDNMDMGALKTFTRQNQGYVWDICQSDYEESLRDFLLMLAEAAQCRVSV